MGHTHTDLKLDEMQMHKIRGGWAAQWAQIMAVSQGEAARGSDLILL